MNDTEIHILCCRKADDEAFRLYGTDSIHDKHVLWPRWLELYDKALADYYHSTIRHERDRKKAQGRIHVEGLHKADGTHIRFKSLQKAESHIRNMKLQRD